MIDTIVSIVTAPLNCITWIIVGAIAGALARRFMGAQDRPFFQDLILGIFGAIVGGFLASVVAGATNTQIFPSGGLQLVIVNLIVATIGAAVLIGLRRMLTGRK